MQVVEDAGFVGSDSKFDLTQEEVKVVFTSSKLVPILGSDAKDHHFLTFTDFCEALTRLTEYKTVVPKIARKKALNFQVSALLQNLIERLCLHNPEVRKRTQSMNISSVAISKAPELPGKSRGTFVVRKMPKNLTDIEGRMDLAIMRSALEQVFLKKQLKAATMVQAVWRGRCQRGKGNTSQRLYATGANKVTTRVFTMTSNTSNGVDEFQHTTTTMARSKYSRRTISAFVVKERQNNARKQSQQRRSSTAVAAIEDQSRKRRGSQMPAPTNGLSVLPLAKPSVIEVATYERVERFV